LYGRPTAIVRQIPSILAGVWEIGSTVEVGFGHRTAWFAWAFALDLRALDMVRKEGFTAKEALVIIGALIGTCRMKKRWNREQFSHENETTRSPRLYQPLEKG
jgi:hypothetical protein